MFTQEPCSLKFNGLEKNERKYGYKGCLVLLFCVFLESACSNWKVEFKNFLDLTVDEQNMVKEIIHRTYKEAYGKDSKELIQIYNVAYFIDPKTGKKLDKPIKTVSLVSSTITDSCEEITNKIKSILKDRGVGLRIRNSDINEEYSIFIQEYSIECTEAGLGFPMIPAQIIVIPSTVLITHRDCTNLTTCDDKNK